MQVHELQVLFHGQVLPFRQTLAYDNNKHTFTIIIYNNISYLYLVSKGNRHTRHWPQSSYL